MGYDVSVVVPTLNEEGNVASVYAEIRRATEGLNCEIVFVDDDSRDQTRGRVAELQKQDSNVRLLHRIGRRGLSSAVQEGIWPAPVEFAVSWMRICSMTFPLSLS